MRLRVIAVLVVPALVAFAQTPAPGKGIFETRCSACDGGDASGTDRVPSLVAYVRYITDIELSAVIREGRKEEGMPSFALADELTSPVTHLRSAAGTNPAMATAGLTGQNRRLPSTKVAVAEARTGSLPLADRRTLEGTILRKGDFSAVLRTGTAFHFRTREGERWREAPIEPKAHWTTWPETYITPSTTMGWNEMWAIDATSGQQVWIFRLPHTDGLLSEAGRGANRGAAVSGDKLLMVTDNAHLLALNRWTGEKLWDAEMGSVKESYSATGAPLVIGDLVISGVSGGEEGARGFVDAYKADTGERVWRFNVIPKRGEKGSETWIGNALEHGCGATWLTGAYDAALDVVYWQTGNPYPDFNGDERKADNLYTASVVALSAETGDLKWHFQFTPHDLHDWDATEPILFVDQPWKGEPRKLLLQANRNGFFFVLHRTNGELLLAEPFVKVNWATGYGKDRRPILPQNFEPTSEGTLTCPASNGGTNWPANSWSPVTRLFYVRATEWCAINRKQADPLVDNRWMGGLAPNQPGVCPFIRPLDINTGKKVWQYPFAGNGRGGLISTAGGIVLFGSSEGTVVALDANSGKSLWHFPVGQNWQASPMTYMVDGKQYFALPGPSGVLAFELPD